jgi:hypothetical protein
MSDDRSFMNGDSEDFSFNFDVNSFLDGKIDDGVSDFDVGAFLDMYQSGVDNMSSDYGLSSDYDGNCEDDLQAVVDAIDDSFGVQNSELLDVSLSADVFNTFGDKFENLDFSRLSDVQLKECFDFFNTFLRLTTDYV